MENLVIFIADNAYIESMYIFLVSAGHEQLALGVDCE